MTEANFISETPKELEPYYQESVSEYQNRGVFFLKAEYLLALHEKFRLFPIFYRTSCKPRRKSSKTKTARYTLFSCINVC